MPEETEKELRVFSVSQFELIVAFFIVIALFVYVLFAALSSDGYMQQYFDTLHNNSDAVRQYDALSVEINSSKLAGNMAVFAFWSTIGLLAYYLVYFLFLSEKNTAQFFKLLFSRGTNKEQLLEFKFAQMAIRVGSIILLIAGINFFVHQILPYIILVLNFSVRSSSTELVINASAVFVLLTVSGHLAAIFLRGALARQRVFLT